MKLLPREVSKGDGIGVVITVTVGVMDVETADADIGVLVSVLIGAAARGEVVDVVEEEIEVAVETPSVLEVESRLSPTCLFCRYTSGRGGGARKSMCISPLSAISLKIVDSDIRRSNSMTWAQVVAAKETSIIIKESIIVGVVVQVRTLHCLAGRVCCMVERDMVKTGDLLL